jgi:hypothetical protein
MSNSAHFRDVLGHYGEVLGLLSIRWHLGEQETLTLYRVRGLTDSASKASVVGRCLTLHLRASAALKS